MRKRRTFKKSKKNLRIKSRKKSRKTRRKKTRRKNNKKYIGGAGNCPKCRVNHEYWVADLEPLLSAVPTLWGEMQEIHLAQLKGCNICLQEEKTDIVVFRCGHMTCKECAVRIGIKAPAPTPEPAPAPEPEPRLPPPDRWLGRRLGRSRGSAAARRPYGLVPTGFEY